MSKHIVRGLHAFASGVLIMGVVVVLSGTTPQVNTATIKLAGYSADDSKSKTDVQLEAQRGSFATPGVGEWFKPGRHHDGRIFAGRWVWQNRSDWLCTNFSKHSGDGIHMDTVHGIPGYSKSNAKAAFKLANASEGILARVSGLDKVAKINSATTWAAWFLSNDKNLHADWKPAYVPQFKNRGEYGAIQKLLAWSHAHGPYKVSVKAPKASVGQKSHGTVTVKAANGHAASLLQVTLSGKRVKLTPQGGLTNKHGKFGFTYKPTDFGRVNVRAAVTAPSSKSGLLTDASPGRQRLLTGNYKEHASGSTHFRTAAGKAEMKSVCTTDCDGTATVTFTGKAPNHSGPMRFRFYVDGVRKGHCDTSGGHSCTVSKKAVDGSKWTGYDFCVLNRKGGHCVTQHVFVAKHQKVVCPPAPTIDQSSTTDCKGCTAFDLTGHKPDSSRTYRYLVKVDGSAVGSWKQLSASTGLKTGNIESGDTVIVIIKAATTTWTTTYVVPTVTVS
jgi:hypothetical protein